MGQREKGSQWGTLRVPHHLILGAIPWGSGGGMGSARGGSPIPLSIPWEQMGAFPSQSSWCCSSRVAEWGWERGLQSGPLSFQLDVGCWGEGVHPLTCLLAHTVVFLWMGEAQCHVLNSPEWVRFLDKNSYNLKQLQHFNSDLGTLWGHPVWEHPGPVLEHSTGITGEEMGSGGYILLAQLRDYDPNHLA